MRNKSILWIFVILLTLIVVYTLSYGFMAKRYEGQILKQTADSLFNGDIEMAKSDSTGIALYKKLLRDSTDAQAYPVFGTTYKQLLDKQLNLGLDLKGGMSVTLEVDISQLLIALSDNNANAIFRKSIEDAKAAQRNSTSPYVKLFAQAWKTNNSGGVELWRIFDTIENKGKFPVKASDDDVLKILEKEAEDAINNTENIIKKRIDQFGVTQPTVQKQMLTGRIVVELPGVNDQERVRKQLKATANLEFWDTYRTDEAAQKIIDLYTTLGKTLAPDLYSQDPNRPRLDSLMGVALQVPDITDLQKDSIRLVYRDTTVIADSLLSEKDLSRKYPLRKLSPNFQRGQSVLGYALASDMDEINKYLALPAAKAALPADMRLVWSAKPISNTLQLYGLKDPENDGKAELDGKHITDAYKTFDPINGDVQVAMNMDIEGAQIWRKMTAKNAADNQRPIAIVMDNRVYSAPGPREEISGGSSVITFGSANGGTQLQTEADDLAGLLKAGSLPAPSNIIDENTVGPSLGEKNIKAGLLSFLIAFVVILIYMIFYYAWAGWAANVALIANLFFLIGALVSLHGSLTLPGIAGIVLTMGTAVDANVLIYERVKEELRLGKGTSQALKDGFLKAISAIIDGNVSIFITGVVLAIVGTGPIKGFATTLLIGIFTTLFSSLLISRLILYRRLEQKKPITFYSSITKNWFTKMNFDFVKRRKLFYFISIAIIAAGIGSWIFRGFNMGVDFAGGTSAKVSFAQVVEVDAVRDALGNSLVEADGQKASVLVQNIGNSGKEYKVTTNYLINSDVEDVENKVSSKLGEAFTSLGGGYIIDSSVKVDATMSDDFRKEAFWAAVFSLLLVGTYILIRFRKWDFALGASIALLHDALVVIAAFTLLNGVLPFSLEINQNFIGAILTVIGFSINDTVVIFDRIREYFKTRKNAPLESTINDALNSTLGRSINTSMTVLLTLLVMFFFGSDDIRGFCFAMIIGVISGVYSTLFIATPIVVDMRKLFGTKEEKGLEVNKENLKAATV